jgi:hypothetical protein
MSKDLVNTTAVNILTNIPKVRVTAKPLIGPVPNLNKTAAAIKVVILASIIVLIALVKPDSVAALRVFPFFNSSLILSKIITLASTAMPIDSIKPAIPGKVNVALMADNAMSKRITYTARA